MVGRAILRQRAALEHRIIAPRSKDLNLIDRRDVYEFIEREQPDLVIHAAGRVGGIAENMSHQAEFLLENLYMGLNVVDSVFKAGVKRFINLGSSCIYPTTAPSPFRENMLLAGFLESTNEGYALAKIATLKLANFIDAANPDCHYVSVISPNLYGPGDKYEPARSHMIPAVIRKLHEAARLGQNEVSIWGDGTARREFMLVDDLADGLWFCVDYLERLPSIINVGIDEDYSVNEYYQAIARIVGYNGNFVHDLDKPVGMKRKLMSSDKIKALGWKPKWRLEQGLEYTYRHFLEEHGNG